MAAKGLNAVDLVVEGKDVHVLSDYSSLSLAYRCYVSLCSTTVCGESACVSCSGTTACC